MNNQQTGLLKKDWKPVPASAALNITIIYETASDEMRAERFSDQVSAGVADGRELTLNRNVWNFSMLRIPKIRDIAARAAASADIVIFSLSEAAIMPAQVRGWIKTWLGHIHRSHPFVVALFAAQVNENAPVRAELRRAAMSKRLDFFIQTGSGVRRVRHGRKFSTREPRGVEMRREDAACGIPAGCVKGGRDIPICRNFPKGKLRLSHRVRRVSGRGVR